RSKSRYQLAANVVVAAGRKAKRGKNTRDKPVARGRPDRVCKPQSTALPKPADVSRRNTRQHADAACRSPPAGQNRRRHGRAKGDDEGNSGARTSRRGY